MKSSSVIFKNASKCWRWGATFQNFLEPAFSAARGKKSFVSWNFGALEAAALRMKDSFKILKKSDYERIITSLNAKETQQKERDEKNREIQRLKELRWALKRNFNIVIFKNNFSQGQVSKWGNTLEGQRKAKLEAKKIRYEKEEEVRRQEDIKEAIYQARAIKILLRSRIV